MSATLSDYWAPEPEDEIFDDDASYTDLRPELPRSEWGPPIPPQPQEQPHDAYPR